MHGFAAGHMDITFYPQPEPYLQLSCTIPVSDRQEPKPALGLSHIAVPGHGTLTALVVRVASLSHDEDGNLVHELDAVVVDQVQPDGCVQCVDFELYNFTRLFMPGQITNGEWVRAGRLLIEEGEWRLIIDSPRDPPARPRPTPQRYTVTHMARIERVDGNRFVFSSSRHFTDSVRLALSLVAGRYVAPCLPVGRDAAGQIVTAEWRQPRIDADQGQWQLLGRSQTADFVELVRRIVRVRHDDYTRELTDYAVGYYLEANSNQMQIELESRCRPVLSHSSSVGPVRGTRIDDSQRLQKCACCGPYSRPARASQHWRHDPHSSR
jgi:hypothetical protein